MTIATTAGQFFQGPLPVLLPVLATPLSFGTCLGVAVLGGFADGPALAATSTVRQGNVPPDRYAQTVATAASFKIAAFSAGSAVAGLLIGVLTVRQLMLGLAVGQLLSVTPLLLAPRDKPRMRNGRVVPPSASAPSPETYPAAETCPAPATRPVPEV